MAEEKPVPETPPSGRTNQASEPDSNTRFRPTGLNLSERFRLKKAIDEEEDRSSRDLDFMRAPAYSTEVPDYENLPKMPDNPASVSQSFHAQIGWNGTAYEWFTVTPDEIGWNSTDASLSSTGAPQGNKTQPAAYHENYIENLPTNLIVRMFRYGSFYVFRTTLENNLPRNVLSAPPEGDEDVASGDSWRVDNQGGNAGFILPVAVGSAYKEDGLETLWGYYVSLEVSVDGRIVAVSSPTQYTINAPDDC